MKKNIFLSIALLLCIHGGAVARNEQETEDSMTVMDSDKVVATEEEQNEAAVRAEELGALRAYAKYVKETGATSVSDDAYPRMCDQLNEFEKQAGNDTLVDELKRLLAGKFDGEFPLTQELLVDLIRTSSRITFPECMTGETEREEFLSKYCRAFEEFYTKQLEEKKRSD